MWEGINMKLRNKKTGEILEDVKFIDTSLPTVELHYLDNGTTRMKTFRSFTELTDEWEEWEDYQPAEPLIEDKEIREIIRAWADVNDAGKLKYIDDENSLNDIYRNSIMFNRGLDLEDGGEYTIEELCGEEEE